MAPTKPPTEQPPQRKTRAKNPKMSVAVAETQAKTANRDKEKDQDRINRKRTQNRISQQCLREKQLAHAQRLEALAEVIKTSTEADVTSAATQNSLLNSQLALIEENRDLRDALLRMRKKMLSLSSAVAAAADDPIFEKLLQKPKRKRLDKSKNDNADSGADDEENDSGKQIEIIPDHPQQLQLQHQQQLQQQHQQQQQVTLQNPVNVDQRSSRIDLDGMSTSDFNTLDRAAETSPASSGSTQSIHAGDDETGAISTVIVGQTYPMPGELNDQNLLMFEEFCFANPDPAQWTVAPPIQPGFIAGCHFVPEDARNDVKNFNMVEGNSWKIEEACLWYLTDKLQLQGLGAEPGIHQETPSRYEATRVAIGEVDFDDSIVSDVVKLAIDIMCRTNGFAEYIYGVGANEPMEQAFRWRLSRSAKNRMAIMEPFRPTPLQFMTTDYPHVIDFINWPTIRDQLIFKLGTYDLDRVIADIVANTVIDIPEMNAAINIHDAFFTKIFSKTTSGAYLLGNIENRKDIGFGGGYWESTTRGQATLGWTANDVCRYMDQRINHLHDPAFSSVRMPPTPVDKRLNTAPKQPLASKWGLDKLYRWKLSREFAEAYPFLDCSAVTTSYPLYAAKLVPEL